eukprot:scaffold1243_cov403-Prasinococcus_capsulatus_cf.AAC.7
MGFGKRKATDDPDEGPAKATRGSFSFGGGYTSASVPAPGMPSAALASSPPSLPSDERKALYVQHLKALNEQFRDWVTSRCSSRSNELLLDGVRDYIKHAEKLKKDFDDVLSNATSSANNSPQPPLRAPISTGATAIPPFGGSNESTQTTLFGTNGNDALGAKSTPSPISLPAAATTTFTPFSFGAAPGTFPSSQPSASNSGAQPQIPSPFGFPSPSTMSPFGASPAGGSNLFPSSAPAPEQNDEEEAAGQDMGTTLTVDDDGSEEVVQELTAKLYCKDKASDPWLERGGKGTLRLRKQKGAATGSAEAKARLVFTTGTGKPQLNAALYSSLHVQHKKNNLIMTLFVIPDPPERKGPPGQAPEPEAEPPKDPVKRIFLIRLAKEDSAHALKNEIEANTPK